LDFSRIEFPITNKRIIHFEKLSPPVVIYVDIEAVPENYRTCLNSLTSSTTKVQKHTACAVSHNIAHKLNPDLNELWTYEGM